LCYNSNKKNYDSYKKSRVNMVNIPIVSIEHIVNYCGKKAYERGKEYLDTRSLCVAYREWATLKALCQGSAASGYVTKVAFDDGGIVHSSCTCYSNTFGPCKHIAALLLAWHANPSSFPDRSQWSERLKKVRKKELIELIEKIVALYPEKISSYGYETRG
jgi:uncharacterized Zn finger protein